MKTYVALVLALTLLFSGCISQPAACTQEAKCPDGSTVGRIQPRCEFAS